MSDKPGKIERKPYEPFRGLKITPPEEELSEEQDIRDYQLKRHAHEFEGAPEPTAPRRPVVLDAPLLGGKKELGSLPYSYAPIVQKALNLIYGQKTLPLYSSPVTAPIGRAIDAYETAKFIQRDPANIMSYAGAPGTLYGANKLAAPFIGAGAGAGVVIAQDHPEKMHDDIRSALRIAGDMPESWKNKKLPQMSDTVLDVPRKAAEQFPFIQQHHPNTKISVRPDRNWAETFPSGEEGSPTNKRPSEFPIQETGVEIYRPDFTPTDYAMEYLHVDPRANAARESLMKTYSPQQIEFMHEGGDYRQSIKEHLPKHRAMANATDALLRGAVAEGHGPHNQWHPEEVQELNATPQQQKIIQGLKDYTEGKAFGGAAFSANVGETPMADGGEVESQAEPEGANEEARKLIAEFDNTQARQLLAQFDNEHPQLAIQSDTNFHFTPEESDTLEQLHNYMLQELRANGGKINTTIDRDPDWDMGLADGGAVEEQRPPVSSEYFPVTADDKGLHLDWNAGIPGKLKRAGEYFYDTMSGQKEMDPTSQEAVDAANTIAGSVTLGAGAGAAPADALRSGIKFPEPLFHATPESFHPSEIRAGSHLGTEAAARHIIKNIKDDYLVDWAAAGAPPIRLLDYKYKPSGDVFLAKDEWMGLPAGGSIIDQMIKQGVYKPKRSDLPKPLSQMGYADWSRIFPEIAKKKGISTIKYTNAIEDAGKPSYIVYDPENLQYLGTYEGKKFADGGAVDDALRLAKNGNLRLHQSLARTGYEDGGTADYEVKGEVKTMPREKLPDIMSVLPSANAQRLEVGPYQRSMSEADPVRALNEGFAQTIMATAGDPIDPSERGTLRTYEQSGTKHPLEVVKNIPIRGRSTVTDPEGRTGQPLYVAGTTPEGKSVALSPGQIADLSGRLARLYEFHAPSRSQYGGEWEGITFPGPKRKLPFGMSQSAMGINRSLTNDKKLPEIMAHETGHAIHNYLDRYENPFEGLSPEAASEIMKSAQERLKEKYQPTKKRKDYVFSPTEMFAESIRSYLTDPATFKQTSPEAAKYLRSLINTDPRINKLLFLSQLRSKQNAAKGGAVTDALRLARSKMAYGGLPEEYMDDDRYKTFQEAGGTKVDPRSEAIGRFLPKMTYHESRDRPTAGAPTSSAAGLAQFTKGTWRKTTAGEPEVAGKSREELYSMRRDPSEAGQQFHMRMAEKLANQNADMLEKRGLPVTPQNLYGVHFGGTHGLRALAAPERTPLRKIFNQNEINANRSVLAGKTAGDFRNFAQKAMSETPRGLPTDLDFKRSQIPSNRYDAMQAATTGTQPQTQMASQSPAQAMPAQQTQTAAIQPQQMAYAKPPQKGFSPDLMMPHSVPNAPAHPQHMAHLPDMNVGSNSVASSDRAPSASATAEPSAPMPAQEAPAPSAPAPEPQNAVSEGPNQDMLQGIEQPFMHLPDFDLSGLFADGGSVKAALRLAKKKNRRKTS